MKLVSFNVNSIRVRLHQLEAVIEQIEPDVIGLQETKVQDKDFPVSDIEAMGYQVQYHGQKSNYGVALMSKAEPENIIKGFSGDNEDSQRRWIGATYTLQNAKKITVLNGYFPQGESRAHETKFPAKQKFYQDLSSYLQQAHNPQQLLALIGDVNIAPQNIDIGIGDDNAKRWLKTGKCSFLPEEREWLDRVFDWGLYDTYREQYPHDDQYFSWFDYRSKGFDREPKRGLRIDLILASKALLTTLKDTGISYKIREMNRPSDHCPIWAEFDL